MRHHGSKSHKRVITIRVVVDDKYLSAASIDASDFILLVEMSLGITFIIGAVGVAIVVDIVGVGASIVI